LNNSPLQLHLSSAYPFWLLLLGTLASVIFAVWSYRRTNPPVAAWLRWLLTVLRCLGLTLGLWLIWEPTLEIVRDHSESALIDVLIDHSASMALKQAGIDRIQQVNDLLASQSFKRLSERNRLSGFGFSDSLSATITLLRGDLPAANGAETDIADALAKAVQAARSAKLGGILLISDGENNAGPDPARLSRQLRLPIWTIGIGSAAQSKDVMITEVDASSIVYQGSKVPIQVAWRAIGVKGVPFDIRLIGESGATLGRQSISADADFAEGRTEFEITVERAGRQQFRVELPHLEGELTADNNRRSFYLNVLANRMRVLVMAGPPDNSLGDLLRRIAPDEHVQVTSRTTKSNSFYEGGWPDEKLLDQIDVIILHHFPTRLNSSSQVAAFAEAVSKKNLPVCLIDGGALEPLMLKSFESVLPVLVTSGRGKLISAQVAPLRRHSIIAEPEDLNYAEKWSALPPVNFMAGLYTALPQAEVLAEFQPGGAQHFPAIIISERAGSKSAALLMRDLWRWGLVSPGSDGVTEPFIQRLIRWLAVRKSDKRVQLAFSKEQFSTQEQVGFTASVYDENYRPFDGAEVQAKVSSALREGVRLTLTGEGKGRYRGSFQPWGEGEYKVQVQARQNSSSLGEDSSSVAVEPFSIELLDTRLNEPLLRQIAEASGGSYAPADSAERLLDSITLPVEIMHEEYRHDLWGGWWHLGAVVFCLGLEWFIRVRMGML
jgi:hypothetical protein